MRVLVVSWYMPPFNTMGALRVGKLCKYLHGQGHDLRVISAADVPRTRSLPVELPEDCILRTNWIDVRGLPRAAQRLRRRVTGRAPAATPSAPAPDREGGTPMPAPVPQRPKGALDGAFRRVRDLYLGALGFPDESIGWYPWGVGAGKRLFRSWRPEVVLASAPPFTGLLIGRRLAALAGVPWVAEYRDRFAEDPYSERGRSRHWLERTAEDRWLRGVAGIVTVSDPWAEDYRARLGVPVATVFNGFDPADFPAEYPRRPSDPATLDIVYTGILYPDRRDPSPLFAAIAMLGADRDSVRVDFYGASRPMLTAMAARHGVADRVGIHDRVAYAESIDAQMNADVLLLLQWNDPMERGNVPGKVFEYLGARRPVLGLGVEDGVPARLLYERAAGVVVNDPAAIAGHLRAWLAEKRAKGAIPLLPMAARDGLARDEQYRKTEALLAEVARRRG